METEDNTNQETQDVADEKLVVDPLEGVSFDEGEDEESQDQKTTGEIEAGEDGSTDTVNEDSQEISDTEGKKDLNLLSDQEKANHAFQKKQVQLNKQKQETERVKKERDALQAKFDATQVTTRPEIPPPPEPFDPDFEEKIKVRDKAIAKQLEYDRGIKLQEEQATKNQQQVFLNREADLKQAQVKFRERATELKINHTDLDRTEDYLNTFITPQNAPTVEFLLKHEDGPLIFQYLGQNPAELEKVAAMAPMNAVAHIVGSVAPAAASLKTNITPTPKPVDILESKKGAEKKDPALEGAEFS